MRRVRSWTRSPQFYLQKAREAVFGVDTILFQKKRETYSIGSFEWLALTETLYGGLQLGGGTLKTDRGGERMSTDYHWDRSRHGEVFQAFIFFHKIRRAKLCSGWEFH